MIVAILECETERLLLALLQKKEGQGKFAGAKIFLPFLREICLKELSATAECLHQACRSRHLPLYQEWLSRVVATRENNFRDCFGVEVCLYHTAVFQAHLRLRSREFLWH